jgi:hypothetical protein
MKNIKTKAWLVLSATIAFSANAVDYVEVERMATKQLCAKSPNTCVPFEEPTEAATAGPYSIDGTLLPADALRDDAQQRAMLPAGLYVKADGSVSQLTETTLADVESVSKVDTKLPVKNWKVPPAVSGADKVIISTGEQL